MEKVIETTQKCINEYMSDSFGSDAASKDYISGLTVFGVLANVFYE